jgi:hypothetical protein
MRFRLLAAEVFRGTWCEPPARHAVLRGWPSAGIDPKELKSRQLEKENAIASSAELLLRAP